MALRVRQTLRSATLGTAGASIEIGTAQANGITVDNYSGYWLQISSSPIFVPPYTIGWASNLYGSVAGSIGIRKATPTTLLINPTAGTQEDAIIVALYEESIPPNPGLSIANRPINFDSSRGSDVAGTTLNLFMQTSAILNISLSCIVTGGTIGHVEMSILDPTGTIGNQIAGFRVSNLGVSTITLEWPNGMIPRGFIAGTWTYTLLLTNTSGINTFRWASNIVVIGV